VLKLGGRIYIGNLMAIKATPHNGSPSIIVETEAQSVVEDIMLRLGFGCSEYNISFADMTIPSCPGCGSVDIQTRKAREEFVYGQGEDAVNLSAIVPVHKCSSCGMEYTTDEADVIRHETLCCHLGVMPPKEITKIREQQGLSIIQVAHIIGVNPKTVERWEKGILIQSLSQDQILHLLNSPENISRLTELADNKTQPHV
jgi:DNA-binding transcriptional regulator YiaG